MQPTATRRRALALGALSAPALLRAQPAGDVIRIGVLTDLAGPYRDVTGPTSVACVRQAVEEFAAQNPAIRVEVIAADHQNKADVGVNTVRQWFDFQRTQPTQEPWKWPWSPTARAYFYANWDPQLPSFAWASPAWRTEAARYLRFWADRKVDGFGLDAPAALARYALVCLNANAFVYVD